MKAIGQMKLRFLIAALLALLPAAPVYAGTCSNPTGNESDTLYNKDYHTYQFCNGTKWVSMGALFTTSTVLPSAGSGYFVMSNGTWTGGLGPLRATI